MVDMNNLSLPAIPHKGDGLAQLRSPAQRRECSPCVQHTCCRSKHIPAMESSRCAGCRKCNCLQQPVIMAGRMQQPVIRADKGIMAGFDSHCLALASHPGIHNSQEYGPLWKTPVVLQEQPGCLADMLGLYPMV